MDRRRDRIFPGTLFCFFELFSRGARSGATQTMPRHLTILDAPSNLGLKPPAKGQQPGVRRLPDVLRADRLLDRLGAADGGRVEAPVYEFSVDAATGIRNAQGIATYSHALAAAIQAIVARGDFPLVLGGDCSILLGSALALRRMGRYGLLYLDGHLDLLTPESSQSKGAAGMDLALATGRGPDLLTDLAGLRPLVRDADVVAFGYRGGLSIYRGMAETATRPRFQWFPLSEVRRRGTSGVAADAITHFRHTGVQGVWIHLDVDVLDDSVMPAVDSRQPDGLSYQELGITLQQMLRSGLAVGMHITILDPDLDPGGDAARTFVAFLVEVLSDVADAGPRV